MAERQKELVDISGLTKIVHTTRKPTVLAFNHSSASVSLTT